MSPRQALTSTLHLFVIFAFLLAGLFFVSLPYLPQTRIQIIDFFSAQFEKCTLIGLGFFLAALVLLVGFYALNRGRYLVLKMGVAADVNLIRHTVEDCLMRRFPKKISISELEIGRKSRIEMKVKLAPIDEDIREELFIQVEKELGLLLYERFGYSKPFYLIVQV